LYVGWFSNSFTYLFSDKRVSQKKKLGQQRLVPGRK